MATPRAARPPHIVILLADDLGYGSVGYHSGASHGLRTPTIDALAREGLRLSSLYAGPKCSPSRAALLSGRHPWRHAGWLTNTPEERAEVLRQVHARSGSTRTPPLRSTLQYARLVSGPKIPCSRAGWAVLCHVC